MSLVDAILVIRSQIKAHIVAIFDRCRLRNLLDYSLIIDLLWEVDLRIALHIALNDIEATKDVIVQLDGAWHEELVLFYLGVHLDVLIILGVQEGLQNLVVIESLKVHHETALNDVELDLILLGVFTKSLILHRAS